MLKGGVGLRKDYPHTRDDAFYEFMSNSEFKILADGSTSAITITATFTTKTKNTKNKRNTKS